MPRTSAALTLVQPDAGRCRCSARQSAPGHHDQLLGILDDPEQVLALFELAVTWGELDYSGEAVVPPSAWMDFAAGHPWSDPERAERTFSLAADMALVSSRR